jgi:hypothetical protein
MLKIEAIDKKTFRVTVTGPKTTTHTVTVDPAYYEKLTEKKVSEERLIRQSFEFLLQRESNTSILSHFDLPIISRYFPEYEDTIKRMLV